MILQKIELNNFGSYKDYNAFNLNTSDPGKKIVIIGGKNGAGKTTLFVAVELALYQSKSNCGIFVTFRKYSSGLPFKINSA